MTVVEIAKQAGISIGTVDRVLHKRGRVSEETRLRVQAIIDASGYQPNPLARHLKRNRQYRIGVLLPELEKESKYWNLIYRGIVDAANELAAFSFKIDAFTFVRPDRGSLAKAFDRMAASDCCVWIIAPVMQDETLVLLMGAEKRVPYIFIDSPLPGAKPLLTVAQDPFRGGLLAGRFMELLSHTDGPFAVVRPFIEAFNLNERARGFTAWFAGRPDVRVIDAVCSETDMDAARKSLDGLIAKNPGLKGIFVVSAMVHKVADYIVSRNLKRQISVIGYDLVDENVQCLKAGKLDGLISQRPEEQGRHVMQQIYRKIVLEEESTSDIDMPFDIFVKENIV